MACSIRRREKKVNEESINIIITLLAQSKGLLFNDSACVRYLILVSGRQLKISLLTLICITILTAVIRRRTNQIEYRYLSSIGVSVHIT